MSMSIYYVWRLVCWPQRKTNALIFQNHLKELQIKYTYAFRTFTLHAFNTYVLHRNIVPHGGLKLSLDRIFTEIIRSRNFVINTVYYSYTLLRDNWKI